MTKSKVRTRSRTTLLSPYKIQFGSIIEPELQSQLITDIKTFLRKLNQFKNEKLSEMSLYRKYFFFGVNEVTNSIEDMTCGMIILNRSTNNAEILQHLPVMATLNKIPCLIINDRQDLARPFKVQSLSVLGVRNSFIDSTPTTQEESFISIKDSKIFSYNSGSEAILDLIEMIKSKYNLTEFQLPFDIEIANPSFQNLSTQEVSCTPLVDPKKFVRRKRKELRRAMRKEKRSKL